MKAYCPSCSRDYPPDTEYEGPILCYDCTKLGDKKHEHSELDVQEELQKNIDKTIKRSMR